MVEPPVFHVKHRRLFLFCGGGVIKRACYVGKLCERNHVMDVVQKYQPLYLFVRGNFISYRKKKEHT